jgi:putative FmdB family regulatory protein
MPIYQYRCESCGVGFERVQHFADAPLTKCPECDGKVHRVIQPVGIIFKGSGFYVTDNRRNTALLPGTKKNGEQEGDKSDKPEKPAPKTDSTSEAKTTTAAASTSASSSDAKP